MTALEAPEHDWTMPHDMRYGYREPGDVAGCPPNCPRRLWVQPVQAARRPNRWHQLRDALLDYEAGHALAPSEEAAFARVRAVLGESRDDG